MRLGSMCCPHCGGWHPSAEMCGCEGEREARMRPYREAIEKMKAEKRDTSDNASRPNDCPLVMVEWEDSAQPIPSWSYLASFDPPGTIRCASVGWLIRDDGQMMALAPNMGAIDDENSVQVSGVIQIPTRCVLKLTRLREPSLTCPSSSRPARARKPRAMEAKQGERV